MTTTLAHTKIKRKKSSPYQKFYCSIRCPFTVGVLNEYLKGEESRGERAGLVRWAGMTS